MSFESGFKQRKGRRISEAGWQRVPDRKLKERSPNVLVLRFGTLRSFSHDVAVHPAYKTFNAGMDITEKRLKLSRWDPPLTTGYHQRICDNHTRGDISSQRGAESTM